MNTELKTSCLPALYQTSNYAGCMKIQQFIASLRSVKDLLHGAPVASSTATCLPETHGDAAHYFDPFSVEDIAKSIDDILSDDKLRNELVKKGKKHVKTFSWQRMAEQTLAVYEKYGRKG